MLFTSIQRYQMFYTRHIEMWIVCTSNAFTLRIQDYILIFHTLIKHLLLCWIVFSVVQWSIIALLHQTSNSVSVWTTVAITADRYMALCHPFLARSYSSVRKAVKINTSIWIVFLIYSLIQVVNCALLVQYKLWVPVNNNWGKAYDNTEIANKILNM